MANNSILLTAQNVQDLALFLALYVSLFCFIGCILGRFFLTLLERYGVTSSESRTVDGH
ncbi:hypothetical protein [Vibrio sp. ABG19]|uniref:hypothetical protein n=1 Tax=Vibrio sp. ABG19 TaxID=2817385 RepID=UPI00249E93F6|nr:hypothetical protein [Vibrio sp. ABG19]WGY45009.1 hypothetical protein J0X00_04710 [Vibrio sp. ABG19]